jgi:hypothetical protein
MSIFRSYCTAANGSERELSSRISDFSASTCNVTSTPLHHRYAIGKCIRIKYKLSIGYALSRYSGSLASQQKTFNPCSQQPCSRPGDEAINAIMHYRVRAVRKRSKQISGLPGHPCCRWWCSRVRGSGAGVSVLRHRFGEREHVPRMSECHPSPESA